jgi:hypothetical protein
MCVQERLFFLFAIDFTTGHDILLSCLHLLELEMAQYAQISILFIPKFD